MVVVVDIETDSANPDIANLKYFGGLDIETGEVSTLSHLKNVQIKDYMRKNKIIVGFNFKNFDQPIIERFTKSDLSKYYTIIDLYECLAPKGDNGFGMYNKNRLHDINPGLQLPNYKLKTILEGLGLDKEIKKGEFDYNILKKDSWTDEEEKLIIEYLIPDLQITKILFDWYRGVLKPLEQYLPKKFVDRFKHMTCTSGNLSYNILGYQSNIPIEYNTQEESRRLKRNSVRIEGGHHIHPKHEKVRGKIICRDFVSHYPTILIMYNLIPDGLKNTLSKLLSERIKAKTKGDKSLALALKIPLNSIFGLLGNPTFKSVYNPEAAANCTRIGRELMKKYAQTLDVAGFVPVYGFTDSVYCGIPDGLNSEDLDDVTKYYIDNEKNNAPNPIDSFDLGFDGEFKFMWFIEKKDNNYLSVTKDNKVKIKGGLFNKNCPKCVKNLFENYISNKIIRDLDVNFSEKELLSEIKKIINSDLGLSGQEYNVKNVSEYKIETSLQCQISKRYGAGKHLLIPNISGIGVGRTDKLKYCSLKEFKEHNLDSDSISYVRMMRYVQPFYSTKEEVFVL